MLKELRRGAQSRPVVHGARFWLHSHSGGLYLFRMGLNVLITGVSSGLGHGLAQAYLAAGHTVYGLSRREPADLVLAGLRFASVDLADAVASQPVVQNLIRAVESFDLIVLNAAKLGQIRDMKDTALEDLRETIEINVWANKWLLDCLLDAGRSVRQVVGISSGASVCGNRGWNGYSISKAAFNMLIALYADEFEATHFTALAPGLIDTAMQDYLTTLPEDARFAPLAKLKAAKGTRDMPNAATCAGMLIESFPGLLQRPSGAYADIRKL
ncbi:MAG: benzil reductase ((S)-benzoin forming) [Lentimonas sp.]